MLERLFKISTNRTDVKTEVLAGISTFLTMGYIVVVNPSILSETGMDFGAVFVATCLAAAYGSLIMGVVANYPVALAPGMGLNAFFTYSVVMGMNQTWQVALGCVFWSGTIFLLLSVFRIREWIINSIPASLKTGIAAGIGLFLAIIALQKAGVVVADSSTLVKMGNMTSIPVILFFSGFILISALHQRMVPGAVIIGIVVVTAIGACFGLVDYHGIVSMPPEISPTFLKLDITGALEPGLLAVIFAFLFVDFFDTSGTLIAIAHKGELLDSKGKLPRLGRALLADSSASIVGSLLGTSTTTSYIESGAGIAAGGRTGLTALTVAVLFLVTLFFSPFVLMIPTFAASSALLFVAVFMLSSIQYLDWEDATEYTPAILTACIMPFTYSISDGIAVGFISYLLIKITAGRTEQVSISVYIIATLSLLKFAVLP